MPSSSAAAAIPNNPMVSSLLAGLRPAADTPLRLRLWNGLEHDLGPNPRVTVALGAPGAIRYFLPPSMATWPRAMGVASLMCRAIHLKAKCLGTLATGALEGLRCGKGEDIPVLWCNPNNKMLVFLGGFPHINY